MASDADRWNDRYSSSTAPAAIEPPEAVATHLADLDDGARALDIACGWGDSGLWLARHGADVTLADVSEVALNTVAQRATLAELTVSTLSADLSVSGAPMGPWDAITCVHFLDRALLPRLGRELSDAGQLVVAVATTRNLERHERPSARFLLELNELPTLVPELNVVHHSEAWRTNNVHEAWLVARRPLTGI